METKIKSGPAIDVGPLRARVNFFPKQLHYGPFGGCGSRPFTCLQRAERFAERVRKTGRSALLIKTK